MPLDEKVSISFLRVQNSAYCERNIKVADGLYYGGDLFDAVKSSLLYTREADKAQAYLKSRTQCAEYVNYIGGILDFFIATTFQSPPKILFTLADNKQEALVAKVMEEAGKLDVSERQAYQESKLKEITANQQEASVEKLTYYNSLNDELFDLLYERELDMMLYGYGLLTASYPEVPMPGATFGQQMKNGELDAKFCYIHTPSVEDWGMDDMGNLQWVKIHTMEDYRSDEFGPPDQEKHTWTYITATQKTVYVAYKPKTRDWDDKKDQGTRISQTPIAFGLPIFECSLVNRACLMKRVERPAISLWNREASLDWALFAQCYGQPWYKGSQKADQLCEKANEFALWMLGDHPNAEVGYLIPQGVVFDALEKNAERKQKNLITSINAEAINIGNRDQHAAGPGAKEMDRAPVESMLGFYANRLKCCLTKAVEYVIRSRKDEGIVDFKIIGLDNFNPASLSTRIDNSAKIIAMPISNTAKTIILKELAQAATPTATAAEREQINLEQEKVDYSLIQSFPVGGAPATSTTNDPKAEESDPEEPDEDE